MRFLIPSMCGTGAETRTDYRTWISLKGKLIINLDVPQKEMDIQVGNQKPLPSLCYVHPSQEGTRRCEISKGSLLQTVIVTNRVYSCRPKMCIPARSTYTGLSSYVYAQFSIMHKCIS